MNNPRVALVLTADSRKFEQGTKRAKKGAEELGRSAKNTKRPLDNLDRSSRKAGKAFGKLGNAASALSPKLGTVSGLAAGLSTRLGGVGVAIGAVAVSAGAMAVAVAKAGDTFKLTEARITALTGSADQAHASMSKIYDLALETGTALESLNAVAGRFTLGLSDLGYGQKQVFDLTEAVIKLGAVGGAGAAEFNAAMIQLSQALASGEFRGEEFRSVSEQMPSALQALSKELGVSTGKLREMAHAGELTTQVVVPALINRLDEVREQYRQLPVTAGRGWDTALVGAGKFLVALDQIGGVSTSLGKFGVSIGEAFSDVAESVYKNSIAMLKNPSVRIFYDVIGYSSQELDAEISRYEKLLNPPALSSSTPLGSVNTATIEEATKASADYNKIWDEVYQKQNSLLPVYEQQRVAVNIWKAETLSALDAVEKATKAALDSGASSDGLANLNTITAVRGKVQNFATKKLGLINAEEIKKTAEEYKQAMEDMAQARADNLANATDWASGIIRAQNSITEAANDNATQAEGLFTNAFDGMTDAITDFAMTGKLNFSDLTNSIIRDMIRMQVQQSVTEPLFTALSNFLSPSAITAKGLPASPGVYGVQHTGGIAGQATQHRLADPNIFKNAPRLHTGGIAGLRSNEIPTILERGEGVFTEAQMKALRPANDTAPQVTVNIINQAGAQVRQQETRSADGGLQIDVIVEQIEGKIAKNIANGDGLAPTLEASYDLKKVGQ